MRRESILDFIQFEDATSVVWPWAIPAEELLQSEELLQEVERAIHFEKTDSFDTDELYSILDQVLGVNPALLEQRESRSGMDLSGM